MKQTGNQFSKDTIRIINPRYQPLAVAVAVALLTASFQLGALASSNLLLDFTGGSANTFGSSTTAGFQFTLSSSMLVTGLGFWDEGANGLIDNHTVGLWNSSSPSVLLASTVVNNSSVVVSSTSAAGDWLFNSIAAPTLPAGTYVVGATSVAGDPDLQRQQTLAATTPGVTFVQAMDVGSPTLLYPSPAAVLNDGLFGPNIEISAVPEPAASALFGLSAVCSCCPALLISAGHAFPKTKPQRDKNSC